MIRFFVAGVPKSMTVGKGVRVPNKGGGFTQFQERVHTEWATLIGHIGRQHAPPAPSVGGVALTLLFRMPRPSSAPKTVTLPLKRPDADNLFHKLSDQWNGVFWQDDSQIVDLVIRKRFAVDGRPGVEVIIEPVYGEAPRRVEQAELAGDAR